MGEGGSQPATLADVARASGVSRQTVSNVINAPHRVRPQTRARVQEAIAALGYEPNRLAQALQAQASRLIGYRIDPMQPDSLGTIHDRFIHALAEAVQAADHQLLVFAATDQEDELRTYERLYRTGAVDGFVLYGIDHHDPRPAALVGFGAPAVAFGRTDEPTEQSWVDIDNAAGTAAAVDHLVARGHRRIGFLGWPEGSGTGDRRAAGWYQAMRRHGLLPGSADLDLRGQDSILNGAQLGLALLDRPQPPTAIVTVSDTLAVGVLQAARGRGLTVGRDLAVVGFDDTPAARVLELSSVSQPIESAAVAIVRCLLPRLPAGRGAEPGTEETPGRLLAPHLVVRASSAWSPVPG
ncbi:MAG TPA: LacI family DNA-binding transcriptional regulator [Micromonosporaceae bacterium]